MLFRRSRLGTPIVLGVAVVTFAALAASSHGFPVQHVSLNDGGIWVTNDSLGTIGRFTKPIAQLDGQLAPASNSTSVDVWQDGPVVAAYDATGGRMYAVNVYGTSFFDAGAAISPVTGGGGIALGDTTLAVLATDHTLRTTQLSAGGGSLSALTATAKPLAAHLPPNSAVAVGSDDTVWVAGGGQLRSYPEGGAPEISGLPLSASDPMQVTTVGDVPVVADPTTGTLYLPDSGHTLTLPGSGTSAGFELQQSSAASDVVIVATGQALYSVNLGSGQLTTLSSGHSGTVAAPVQVDGCVHAAWANGSTGSYVRSCGSPPPATSTTQTFNLDDDSPQLVFRVNNGAVVLNDTTDGGVFLVDSAIVNTHPKWQLSDTAGKSNTQAQTTETQQKTKLVANPYTQGVRPGTTTVVHVLDAVKGEPGVTYEVTAVGTPDQPGVTVSVAPDAQTVLATVTTLSTDAHFQYTVTDGHGNQATSEVTLVPRSPSENSPPALRPGYQQPALFVAASGTLVIPVIGDWRDFDGDPLYIESDSVTASAGSAAVTSGGALSFTAPQTPGDETATISYGVSDGRVAKPVMATLKVSVLGTSSQKFIPPTPEPDAAQAVVGAPVTIEPLANDIPGVDPTNPDAQLALAAPVPAVPGATVSTDLADGTVTFTAQHPGDFFLTYTDAFGAAPTANGTIRVHVIPASGTPKPPVTTPDVAVLHGQQPAIVDVLADDYDPQGWILGVTGATSSNPGVQVTVVDQQWLRVSADDPQPGTTATVDYTVSDGHASATGTVAVSAEPADLNDDQITTTEAAITVMAGDSAAVPVLAGDSSSIGLPLSLAGTPPTAAPPVAGLLASVQGSDILVTAPASVKSEEETTVSYVATDASGATATGTIDVTIEPPPSRTHPDQAPVPEEVDARETAGDVAVIPIPVYGVDPEGDSVTVTGVTVPPALGRIVAIGPDTISYQSYPDSAGTDTFTYQVTDPYGLTGTAQVRIAVLPPGPPQPPVATDVVLNAPPGASLHWNVVNGDFVAPGDSVTVEPLSKTNKTVPAGVSLKGDYVYLKVPASPSDPPVEFAYGITDGSTPSLAQVIVHAVTGAQIPPIANNAVAPQPPAGAGSVTVNVLKNDDDPVGSPADLKISWVPAGVTAHGPNVTIKLAAQPREVPYQITAPDGLSATAVVFVPGTSATAIRLRPGARIVLKKDGSISVPLSSVLLDTSGRQLKITTLDELSASPGSDLAVTANQVSAFQVRALGGYTGPGAVTVQVYDGATMQDPHGNTATVTIPAQVGPDVPILRCPAQPIAVVEGGAAQSYDIGQLCHVWVDTTAAVSPPHYTAAWTKAAGGVSTGVPGGTTLQLSAASGATPGATGTLEITPAGASAGGTLNIVVVKAPPPSGSPVSVTVKAGHSVTVDLSQYVTSPLAQPDIQVLNVTQSAGTTVSHSGSTVTIAPGANIHGSVSLVATVTDVPGRADRSIPVAITVTVIGHPGAPGPPTAKESSHTLVVSFTAAAPNGAPVEFYTVYTNGAPHQCPAAPCTVSGLNNGTTYTVYVTATNSDGPSQHSATTTGEPNAIPGQVTRVQADQQPGQANKQITLSWQPPVDDGTPITNYQVLQAGQQPVSVGTATSHTFTGLTNGTSYTFYVTAVNAQGGGPISPPVSAIPYGDPLAMTAAPTVQGAPVADPAVTQAIQVTWVPVPDDANGRPVTSYTVYEYSSAANTGPWAPVGQTTVDADVASTSFTVTNNSTWYEYTVAATNEAGESGQSPMSAPLQAAVDPDPPTNVTETAPGPNTSVQVNFTVPAANAKEIAAIEYGVNQGQESGTIAGPFTGATASVNITSAMSNQIVNGTPVTIEIAACNDAGYCSPFVAAAAPATPYGPIGNPTVTATANGTTIDYTWSAPSDGLTETFTVCIAGACNNYTVQATGGYNGNSAPTYGYSQTETITGHLTDTSGQSSATETASATTEAAPPPPLSETVAKGQNEQATVGTGPCVTTDECYDFLVTIANFPANTDVYYACSDGGQFWPEGGGTIDKGWNGGTIVTNGSGNTSFYTQCVHAPDGSTVTINVDVGGKTDSAGYTT
jgi:large repetitive protein